MDVVRIHEVKLRISEFINEMKNTDWWQDLLMRQEDKLFLTGGAIASLLQDEQPKDWDFYFNDYDLMWRFKQRIENDYTSYVSDVDEKYKEFLGQDGKMITANAITMNDNASFITLVTGTPQEIRKTFDYVHCTPYYDLKQDKLYISKQQYDACVKKMLIVNNKMMVKAHRTDKFLERGYKMLDILKV